jgi:hypothetical protein
MTDYVGEDRFEISKINKIADKIKFVTDIGIQVKHLIEVLKQSNMEEEIHLDGDYRTLVPQSIVNDSGISFSGFETYLIDLLKK